MKGFLYVVLLIDAILLIVLSLLQSGKSDGITGAFTGGEGLNLFANVKERGAEKVISQVTMLAGICFFLVGIAVLLIK